MQRQAFLALLVGLQGGIAAAGGLPFEITSEGRFSGGYTDRIPGADAYLFGDATLRLSWGRFGAELGVFGRADALDTPHETYGALTWDIGPNGRLSAGVPRPAYDGVAVSALEAQFPSLGIDRVAATRSEATAGAMFGNYLPFGVAFENRTDRLRYAVSVHRNETPDVTILGLGAGTEVGDWTLEGALEAGFGASTEVSGKVQVSRDFGSARLGAGYFAPATAGDLVEVLGSVTPVERVTVSGVVQVPVDGSDPTAGLAARYGLRDGLDVSVGVASDAGAAASVSAFLDFRF